MTPTPPVNSCGFPEDDRSNVPTAPESGIARPTWDEYFMTIATQVATRSTCLRRRVGAVLVHQKRILATGYNGAPRGLRHCAETGCLRQQLNVPSGQRHEICRALHAEMNALLQAAMYGIPVEGADLYCTTQPCILCAKMLINAGVKRIYMKEGYPDEMAVEMLKEADVELILVSSETQGSKQ